MALRPFVTRIALNSLWLLAARIASQGLMLVFTVLVARYLGQAGLGQYALVASLVFLGNVLTTFGLDTFLIREIAVQRSAAAASLAAALGIQLGLSALVIGGVNLAPGWLGEVSATAWALRIYSLSLIPLAFTTAFSASLRAYERMDLILALNLFSSAAQTGGAWLLLASGGQLVALSSLLVAVQMLAALAAGAMCFLWLPGFGLILRIPTALVRHMVRQGIPLVLLAGLMVAYQRMGVLMLSLLAGDAITGWFAAAARVTDALKMIHYAFFGAIFPVMSRLAVRGRLSEIGSPAGLEDMLSRTSLWFLLSLGLLAALAISLLAGPAIRLLYGMDYAPAAPALQILAWSLIPFAINTYAFFWLVSRGRETTALKVSLASAGSAVVLHAILIRAFGLVGACLAVLLGEVIQAAFYLPYVRGRMAESRGAAPLPGAALRILERLPWRS
jgi:O-antigen/teichoic acid export membrane protein